MMNGLKMLPVLEKGRHWNHFQADRDQKNVINLHLKKTQMNRSFGCKILGDRYSNNNCNLQLCWNVDIS